MTIPKIPIGDWFEAIIDWVEETFDFLFDIIADVIEFIVNAFYTGFIEVSGFSPFILVLLFALLAWKVSGAGVGIFSLVGFSLIVSMELWGETMETFAMILTSGVVALGVGIPIGILAAKNDIADKIIRPMLDFMQTMPAFVYLIPAVIFFSLGIVPGVIATVIFAMPPAIRLTNLGIRQVDKEVIEAGKAFGSTSSQLLYKIQLPLAVPTIMAGVNQTIMLALSMVVIASMIGAGGLGNVVLRGIQQLQIGTGFEGGLSVVILAIFLDRLTQSLK
ncbi:ABC transporter permease [Natranaerobius trueperi]|uniref:Glycine/betaine ABC transporter n=1 Tax=Natranaerobius trueperi TaxID=759412 RepID=A0A226BXN1_9FIRM|nr:proline/glycine betaine ABC transporter permease [Natranaerobius trueperi]OWZ82959.1 glycine/betaine ABC transporter [Natranaerobius trueperi]